MAQFLYIRVAFRSKGGSIGRGRARTQRRNVNIWGGMIQIPERQDIYVRLIRRDRQRAFLERLATTKILTQVAHVWTENGFLSLGRCIYICTSYTTFISFECHKNTKIPSIKARITDTNIRNSRITNTSKTSTGITNAGIP